MSACLYYVDGIISCVLLALAFQASSIPVITTGNCSSELEASRMLKFAFRIVVLYLSKNDIQSWRSLDPVLAIYHFNLSKTM
jgi:hypothetical protein